MELKKIAAKSAIPFENFGIFRRQDYGHSLILENNILGNVSMAEFDEMIEILDF